MIVGASMMRAEERERLQVQDVWLPWPPSINTYWRRVGPKTLISRKGRAFRKEALQLISCSRLRGYSADDRLMVRILVYTPDERRRDLDNLAKVPIDCLQAAHIIPNDEQIDSLWVVRRGCEPGGMIQVQLARFTDAHQDAVTLELGE